MKLQTAYRNARELSERVAEVFEKSANYLTKLAKIAEKHSELFALTVSVAKSIALGFEIIEDVDPFNLNTYHCYHLPSQ